MKYLSGDTELATVSIGGNDIFFGDILLSCIVYPLGACDEQLQKARDTLYSLSLYNTYEELFETMQNKMEWTFRANRELQSMLQPIRRFSTHGRRSATKQDSRGLASAESH